MSPSDMATPEVLWAQRSSLTEASKNYLYVTISVPDIPKESLKLDLESSGLKFRGESKTLKKTYHLELDFYADIDPAASVVNHTAKNIEMKLQKKELAEAYWPRLLKDSKKVHFLKTDFDKWVDEDEQNEAAEDDFSGFGGMGGMPGMGAGGDFGGIDFSKLGGVPPPGEDEDEELGSDDEDMPGLEGDEDGDVAKPAATEAKEDAKA